MFKWISTNCYRHTEATKRLTRLEMRHFIITQNNGNIKVKVFVAITMSATLKKKKGTVWSAAQSRTILRGPELQKQHSTKGAKTNDLNCALTDAVVKVTSSSVCILKVLVAVQQLSGKPSAAAIPCSRRVGGSGGGGGGGVLTLTLGSSDRFFLIWGKD